MAEDRTTQGMTRADIEGETAQLKAAFQQSVRDAAPLSVAEKLDAFREVLTARRQEMAPENDMETPRPHQHERDTGYGY